MKDKDEIEAHLSTGIYDGGSGGKGVGGDHIPVAVRVAPGGRTKLPPPPRYLLKSLKEAPAW